MVEQTYTPISRVDLDRLYVDQIPESWRQLEERTVQLLERQLISSEESKVMIYVLRTLEQQAIPVPRDAGDLYVLMRPMVESLPGVYA